MAVIWEFFFIYLLGANFISWIETTPWIRNKQTPYSYILTKYYTTPKIYIDFSKKRSTGCVHLLPAPHRHRSSLLHLAVSSRRFALLVLTMLSPPSTSFLTSSAPPSPFQRVFSRTARTCLDRLSPSCSTVSWCVSDAVQGSIHHSVIKEVGSGPITGEVIPTHIESHRISPCCRRH